MNTGNTDIIDMTQILISKKFEKEMVLESSVLAWIRNWIRIRIEQKCFFKTFFVFCASLLVFSLFPIVFRIRRKLLKKTYVKLSFISHNSLLTISIWKNLSKHTLNCLLCTVIFD
jgi:hypothetical protein